jgi:hypothetical protein
MMRIAAPFAGAAAGVDLPVVLLITLIVALLVTPLPAQADVTVVQSTTIRGIPVLGDASMKSTTQVAGEKQRVESTTEFKKRIARWLAGDAAGAEITRLDRALVWAIDPGKKTYTEMTFDQVRDLLRQTASMMSLHPAPSGGGADPGGWKVETNRNGEKRTIAGVTAERATIVMNGTARDRQGDQAVPTRWTMDLWLAQGAAGRPDLAGLAELEAFSRKYSEKMGLSADMAGGATRLLAAYSGELDRIAKEMQGIGGYPLESHLKMETKGGSAPKDSANPVGPDGYAVVLEMDTVVESISGAATAGEGYEIPVGFKKAELKLPKSGEKK